MFGNFRFQIPGFGNVSFDDRRGIGFRGHGVSGNFPVRGLFGGHGGGWGRDYGVGGGELVGPYPNEAMARAYGRAEGAMPYRQRLREQYYGEGVVREGYAPVPRGHGYLPPAPREYAERYDPRAQQWERAPQQPPHAQGAPMDIRPPAQQHPRSLAPQQQTQPAREPTAAELAALQKELCKLPKALVHVMQMQLEGAGFGALSDAQKYSKVDGVAGPLTARGFFDYAQSRGLNPNDVQASLRQLRAESAQQSGVRGGQPVERSEAAQPNMFARNGDAAIRLMEMRDNNSR